MLHKKTGYPEESEIVMCTVTKVHPNSVFARLDEYDKSGMIHISEISPGRIRNIRDYVKESKVIVCKVLRINEERGHIDLSLRRVTDGQRRNKVNQIKQEQKAEKIVEFVANKAKVDFRALHSRISEQALKSYESLHAAFEDIVAGNIKAENLGVSADVAKILVDVIKQRIKPPVLMIKGYMHITSYASDGVEMIKKALGSISDEAVSITYSGGGKYRVVVTSDNYKDAEKRMQNTTSTIQQMIEKGDGRFSFERAET